MKTRLWVLVIAVVAAASVGLHSQQQPSAPASALPSPPQREPAWAFPVQAGSLPAESPEPKSVEGSTKKYTPKEIDDLLEPAGLVPRGAQARAGRSCRRGMAPRLPAAHVI